jgi:hypothetical protein
MEDDLYEDDILDEVSDDEDDEGFLGNNNDNQQGDVAMVEAVREAPRRARNHAAVDDEPPLEGYARYASFLLPLPSSLSLSLSVLHYQHHVMYIILLFLILLSTTPSCDSPPQILLPSQQNRLDWTRSLRYCLQRNLQCNWRNGGHQTHPLCRLDPRGWSAM